MKKALLALLSVILSFSLFACTPDDPADQGGGDDAKNPGLSSPIELPFTDIELGN